MPMPTYKEWKTWTDVPFSFRSSELKKVDKALEELGKKPDDAKLLRQLRTAWKMWKRSKGAGDQWKRSERNNKIRDAKTNRYHYKGICEELDDALGQMYANLSAKDQEIVRWQDQQRRLAVQRLFLGKKITLRRKIATNEARKAVADAQRRVEFERRGRVGRIQWRGGRGSRHARRYVRRLDRRLDYARSHRLIRQRIDEFDDSDRRAFESAAVVIKDWGKVIKNAYSSYSASQHAYAFRPGAAASAFRGLQTMLSRATDKALASALIASADFGARGVASLCDGGAATGAAIGAATALANLCHKIALFAIEYKETKAANAILADPTKLDFRLFEAKPLMGCYMVCCAELGDIVTMSQVQFGAADWLDDVEAIKKAHIDPIRKVADNYIRQSPFEIEGLSSLVPRGKASDAKYLASLY